MRPIGLVDAFLRTGAYPLLPEKWRRALRGRRLGKLVSHAREKCPYFTRLYSSLPENWTLRDLPPTNKRELMARFEDWTDDRSLTLDELKRFAFNSENDGELYRKKYLIMTTSGTTGEPAVIVNDRSVTSAYAGLGAWRAFARKRDLLRISLRGGNTAGLFAGGGSYFSVSVMKYFRRLFFWKKNGSRLLDSFAPVPELVARLNEIRPQMLAAYPSVLELLIDERISGRLKIEPLVIMAGGEAFRDSLRERLESAFGCYVQTHYTCTEGGMMACECTERHLHVNEDWVILEAVDEQNRPVPDGQTASHLLLTCFYSHVQPIIRYELSDSAVLHREGCPCGSRLPWISVEGRERSALSFDGGVRFSSLELEDVVYHCQLNSDGGGRIQLVMENENSFTIRATDAVPESERESLRASTENFLRNKGVSASVAISDAPPIYGSSGKFHVFIRV